MVQPRVIADLFERRQNLEVLQESFGNLFSFRVMRKVVQTEDLALPRQRKFRIEGSPVNLIAELDAG